MAFKDVVRCAECSNAARKIGFGFTGPPALFCTERSGTVDDEGGCTFGAPGSPRYAADRFDIELGSDAAVKGY